MATSTARSTRFSRFDIINAINVARWVPARAPIFTLDNVNIDKKTNVWSGMMNGWLDFGGNGGIGGGVGAGFGYAGVHQFGDSNSKFAWQLLAQAYYPISENLDIGLKYRYFHAGSSDNVRDFAFNGPAVCNALPGERVHGWNGVPRGPYAVRLQQPDAEPDL